MLTTIPSVLNPDELRSITQLLQTAQWSDGKLSAGTHARTIKSNQEMDQASDNWKKINQLVCTRLFANAQFQSSVLPHRLSAAFISRCGTGMRYGMHVDDAVMGSLPNRYRSDVAITVFLSSPEDYSGGELSIRTSFGQTDVKLPAGHAVAYPASSLHQVNEVTNGVRIVAVLWAQSLVRCAEKREILAGLDTARAALMQATPQAQVTQSVDHAYMNLLRMWSEV